MADKEKAPEAKAEGKRVTLLNRGKRHFDLPKPYGRVSPGDAVEVSAEDAQKLAAYVDLVDASKLKIGGKSAAETAKLKADNADLAKENEELRKQLADKKGK